MPIKRNVVLTPSTQHVNQHNETVSLTSAFTGEPRLISENDLSICRNIGDRQSLKKLIDFKEVISQQLPKMPKDYITKILFNPKH